MSVIPCNRENCLCEHIDPCAAGWVTFRYKVDKTYRDREGVSHTTEVWYDGARPCPTCDPERAHIFETSATQKELHERLKARSTLNRTAQQENYEASRTRTL